VATILAATALAAIGAGPATAQAMLDGGRAPATVRARATAPCHGTRAPKRYRHVVWIWFENHGIDKVIGARQAPYFTSIARSCGLATHYSAITHPSLPNYIAATSGGTQGIHGDGPPSKNATRARSIFELARSWKAYEESMPRPCHLRNGGSGYAVRHDPSAYYLRLRPALCRRDVALGSPRAGALASDLRRDRLPAFSFITPNTCNDMHDCGVSTGDAWLRRWLPVLLASRAYRSGTTAIFVTFDESERGGSNHVAMIAIAPSVRRGSRTAVPAGHYALLRTTESMLGLRPLLGNAAHAGSLRSRLHL
jgi:phosphatidylinositol-3-phosphatase